MDAFLLNRIYTPLSRVAGRRWGSTACSLSRACVAPLLVFGGVMNIAKAEGPLWGIIFPLILAAMFWINAERADLTPNPYSLEPPFWRLIWLALPAIAATTFTPQLHAVAALFYGPACLSVIYFRAVPAPPPKERRQPRASAQLAET